MLIQFLYVPCRLQYAPRALNKVINGGRIFNLIFLAKINQREKKTNKQTKKHMSRPSWLLDIVDYFMVYNFKIGWVGVYRARSYWKEYVK